jgi:hypothetical protein
VNTGLQKKNKSSVMSYMINKEKETMTEFKGPKYNTGFVLISASGCITPNCPNTTLQKEEQPNKCSNTSFTIIVLIYFNINFLMK